MILFNEGQRPLMEFLRNLTPQVLLGSTALLLGIRLDFGKWDLSNWFNTLAFFLCVALTLVAFFVNMNLFLDALINSLDSYSRVARRLRRRGSTPRTAVCGTLKVMFRERRWLWLDFLASVAIVVIGLTAISFAMLNAVKAALR